MPARVFFRLKVRSMSEITTKEEVDTYLEWTVESFKEVLSILRKNKIDTSKIDAILSKQERP